jgi:hypothetical protein
MKLIGQIYFMVILAQGKSQKSPINRNVCVGPSAGTCALKKGKRL